MEERRTCDDGDSRTALFDPVSYCDGKAVVECLIQGSTLPGVVLRVHIWYNILQRNVFSINALNIISTRSKKR